MAEEKQVTTSRSLSRMAWFAAALCLGCCAVPLAAVVGGLGVGGSVGALVAAESGALAHCLLPLAVALASVAMAVLIHRVRRRKAAKACAMDCDCRSS